MLSGIITELQPKRIIEVGSGFSSAVILDTLDRNEFATSCVFVDPYPDRLKSLLRPNDLVRVTILELPVQRVDLGIFRGTAGRRHPLSGYNTRLEVRE